MSYPDPAGAWQDLKAAGRAFFVAITEVHVVVILGVVFVAAFFLGRCSV